ncbi:MAG: alpha-1,4 polygalactosaminidase [Rhodobacteraceae bacterium]|nr:alpha-1,4 polygalactosaminidase [Paracoccaceae bacterium]
MTDFTIATFNVKNLIGPGREYYKFEQYTDEEYAWKEAWMAEQLVTLDADIVAFQEVFEEEALRQVVDAADKIGKASNEAALPDRSKSYRKKAIFRKLSYTPYKDASLTFAPNANDGPPGKRRPGLAVLSRLGFAGQPEIIQDLNPPLEIPFQELGGGAAGGITLTRLSRPILKVRIQVKGQVITLFNVHLKSKLGEHITLSGADFAPEADLVHYDPVGRAMGSLRAGLRRMAEAWVLRREVVAEIKLGNPVVVLGDLNDGEHAVSSEIISGEKPFRNYAWMRRHDAKTRDDRYSNEDAEAICDAVEAVKLTSAEAMFVRKSLRDMVYTSAFGGVFESIDQILLSRHFHPDNAEKFAEMLYFSTLNDHITDGSHPEAPYNKLASDHGQIMAHFRLRGRGGKTR